MDFATARRMMVDGQVRTADVTNLDILAAMQELPRERFVSAANAELAYLDIDLPVGEPPVGCRRRLLKPMVLGKLVQAAQIGPSDRVLDVGCATGYSAAVLSRLAGSVIALEEDADLARRATHTLHELGIGNVTVVTGSLKMGWPAVAPYDVILLEGASEVVPRSLFGQLGENGRLLGVIGTDGPASRAMLYRSDRGDVSGRPIFDAAAPLLPGFAAPPAFVF